MTVDEAIRVVRGDRARVTVEDLKSAGVTLGREVLRLRAERKRHRGLVERATFTVDVVLRQLRALEGQ